jgi:hypothetical protein
LINICTVTFLSLRRWYMPSNPVLSKLYFDLRLEQKLKKCFLYPNPNP